MRQTIRKEYDNETQYSSNAIIIGAHCPSRDRTERCIDLITQLKDKFPDYTYFICSHLNIDDELLNLTDYFIYNRSNAVINYDIKDKRTDWKVYGIYQPGIGQQVNRPTHNNSYAHYIQVYDGLSMAIGQRMTKIHYMSYDVSFDVVDKISLHRDFLDHYDVINYTFRDQNYINSEFFSITDDGAKNSIMKKLSFDEYINTGFGDFGHENVYANIFNNCKVKTMGHFYSDDRKDPWVIGDFTALPLNTKKDGLSGLPISIDGLIVIPYWKGDDMIICIANGYYYENGGTIASVQLIFHDEDMKHVDKVGTEKLGLHYWAQFYPAKSVRYITVQIDNTDRLTFDLLDRKNHGWIQ
jgi:hypothetical protein